VGGGSPAPLKWYNLAGPGCGTRIARADRLEVQTSRSRTELIARVLRDQDALASADSREAFQISGFPQRWRIEGTDVYCRNPRACGRASLTTVEDLRKCATHAHRCPLPTRRYSVLRQSPELQSTIWPLPHPGLGRCCRPGLRSWKWAARIILNPLGETYHLRMRRMGRQTSQPVPSCVRKSGLSMEGAWRV